MNAIFSALLPCSGAGLFVDPENGDDKNYGLSAPVLNISTAVECAEPIPDGIGADIQSLENLKSP